MRERKVYGHTPDNFTFIKKHLEPIKQHILAEGGLGFINEIFDGDLPHRPVGCIAQAWSVAELLRALKTYPELSIDKNG